MRSILNRTASYKSQPKKKSRFQPRLESLEARNMLAADPIITEFMASNNNTLDDGNGSSSDWIEIYNAGDMSIDLEGWHLTDDVTDLTKWEFPSADLGAGEYLVVFASNDNMPDGEGNLHTNFKLSSGGEYLALVEQDGTTIASEFTPTFPPQFTDTSYGVSMDATTSTFLTAGSEVEVLIPTDDLLGNTWQQPGFVLGPEWITESEPSVPATTGVGFDTGVAGPELIAAWPLNDDVGANQALDFGPGGYNGDISGSVTLGTTGAAPVTGSAASFTNGLVNVPYDPALNTENFSLAVWAKVTGGGGFRSVVTNRNDLNPNSEGFVLYAGSDNNWQFWTGNGAKLASNWDVLTGPAIVTDQWTHIVISFDSATKTKSMYVNGQLAASLANQEFQPNAQRDLHIGKGGDFGAQFPFVGDIDEVELYDVALDAADVNQLFSSDTSSSTFHPISSVTTNTVNFFNQNNMIQGSGVGYSASAPHNALGEGSGFTWVTNNPNGGDDYYDNGIADPEIIFDLGEDVLLSEISVWGYASTNSNGIRDFNLDFATELEGPAGFETSITYNPAFQIPTLDVVPRHSFDFTQNVTARYVKLTVTDNQGGIHGVAGGDRVGIGEVAFESSSTSGGGLNLFEPEINTDLETQMLGTNASSYLRIPFNVADTAALDSLILRMKYDDGFIAYLNGQEVASRNAPASPTFDSNAIGFRSDFDALVDEEINITSALQHLVVGENILAIHALNLDAADEDFLIVPELEAVSTIVNGAVIGYFDSPSPGSANSSSTSAVLPVISNVSHSPNIPTQLNLIVVTAQLTETTNPVSSVNLVYRVMYGPEVTVGMVDDGTGSDAVAGDGIYTGVIPPAVSNDEEMIRYYITAEDSEANVQRAPKIVDTTGQDRDPEYFGTVVVNSADVESEAPVFRWFAPNGQTGEDNAHTRAGERVSVFYNGEFYDNIFARRRGQATNAAVSQKFDFNDDHLFFVSDTVGRVEEININGNGSDPSFLRQTLAFDAHRVAGVPSSESFLMEMQVNGSFDRVGIYIEQVDDLFLERNDLDPEGALYKFVQRNNLDPVFNDTITGIEKKTRKDEDFTDIQAVVDGLNLGTQAERKDYVFDNFNVPQILNYLAVRAIIQDADDIRKNFYFYRDTNGTGEWEIYPWDNDFTFGVLGDGGPNLPHPFFGEFEHLKFNANQWNVMIDVMFDLPETQEMYLRRLRTLMDDLMGPAGTADIDTYFMPQIDAIYTPAQNILSDTRAAVKNYFNQRRIDLYDTHSIDNVGGGGVVSTLVPEDFANARYFVPGDNSVTDWTDIADPANILEWGTGQIGIGYEDAPENYVNLIKTVVDPALGNNQTDPADDNPNITSTYVRIPFTIPDQTALNSIIANGMTLQMKYDDGFVAYLNGAELVRPNITGALGTPVSFDAFAANHPDNQAVVFQNYNISSFVNELVVGTNVLAIQGVNTSLTSSDMLILPQLLEGVPVSNDVAGIPHEQIGNPTINFGTINTDGSEDPGEIVYNPISGVQDEEYISLINPNATAVDISGWQLTGGVTYSFQPGTVIPASGTLYVSPDVNAFRTRTTGPSGGQSLFVQGGYSGHISNLGETINLLADDLTQIATIDTPFDPSDTQQFLRITEIMYNPSDAVQSEIDAGFSNNDDFEFIELVNISEGVSATTLNLTDVTFSDAIDFTFPANTMLAAGERILVVRNQAAFTERYGSGHNIAGEYLGADNDALSNGGENINLEDAEGSTIHDFKYEDGDDIGEELWHPQTDGNGASLVMIDAGGDITGWGDPLRWRASVADGGSPGAIDNLAADFDTDGKVGLQDLLHLKQNIGVGTTEEDGDLTGDSVVDAADVAAFVSNYGTSYVVESITPPVPSAPAAAAALVVSVNASDSEAVNLPVASSRSDVVDQVLINDAGQQSSNQQGQNHDRELRRASKRITTATRNAAVDQAHAATISTAVSPARNSENPFRRAHRKGKIKAAQTIEVNEIV